MSTTRIKALIGFSDGEISMYSGQIDNIDATKASAYISGGLAVEYTDPINPTGSLNITANGTYDVTDKANAVVNVAVKTVTYNVNGGTGSVDAETVSVGQSVALDDGAGITPPEGKEFSGWGESAAATETIESPYTPTADVTLYAVYVDSTQ